MRNGVVLILTNSRDSHADIVEEQMNLRGINIIRLDTDNFFAKPNYPNLILDSSGLSKGIITVGGQSFHSANVVGVWYRRPETIRVDTISDPGQKEFAERELNELMFNFYYSLRDHFWVSDILALENARRKFPQLTLAHKIGFAVPRTLLTNQPELIRSFFRSCPNGLIYKTLHTPVVVIDDETFGIQSSYLTEKELGMDDKWLVSNASSTSGIIHLL